MVKFATIVALASGASAAVMDRAPEETSPVKMNQVPQELAMPEAQCKKVFTAIAIKNACDYPVHVWRDDSSVDKAAVLQPNSALVEPMRYDWRSGYLGYRLSPSPAGPYDGNTGTTTLTYLHKVDNKAVSVVAQVSHVFKNAFDNEDISLGASAFAYCNQNFSELDGDKLVSVAVRCSGDIEKGGLTLGLGLCMRPGTYKV